VGSVMDGGPWSLAIRHCLVAWQSGMAGEVHRDIKNAPGVHVIIIGGGAADSALKSRSVCCKLLSRSLNYQLQHCQLNSAARPVTPTLKFANILNAGTVNEGTPSSDFSIFDPLHVFLESTTLI
jgi:hypothetical protein